jgi:hypothetical protein
MDKLKRIEDQIRLQESLIGSLRYQLAQRRPQESYTAITAQLTHALAGLAALCRVEGASVQSRIPVPLGRGVSIEWYKIKFADGWKAVGIYSR